MDSRSCRCCLKSDVKNEMKNLLDSDKKNVMGCGSTYVHKLTICIPELSILNSDPYANKICLECATRLEETYEFRILCINSDQQLRLRNSIKTIKIEEVEFGENDLKVMRKIESLEKFTASRNEVNVNTKERLTLNEPNCLKLIKLSKNCLKKPIQTQDKGRYSLNDDTILNKKRTKIERYNEFGKRTRIRRLKVKCDVCGYLTYSKFEVEQHMRVHTGERPFICEICGIAFKTKGAVKNHALRHRINRIKRYSCDQCSYTTDLTSDYKRHLRLHAGDLPYPCTKCERRFACKGALRNHHKTFHEDKPHPCHICDAKFRTTGGLLKHTVCHYRGSTNVCHVCKKLLSNARSLKAHMKALHPSETDIRNTIKLTEYK